VLQTAKVAKLFERSVNLRTNTHIDTLRLAHQTWWQSKLQCNMAPNALDQNQREYMRFAKSLCRYFISALQKS